MKERLLRAGVPGDRAAELQEQYEAMTQEEQRNRDEHLAGISDSDIRTWAEPSEDAPAAAEPVADEPAADDADADADAAAKAQAEAEAKEKAATAQRSGLR